MDDLIERLRANGLDECDEAIIYIEALERQVKAADALADVCAEMPDHKQMDAALEAYLRARDT